MFKQAFRRAALAAALILTTCYSAIAAGSISLSGAVQLDTQGQHMAGCLLYTYQSGTTTPQTAYQDTSLSIAWPNPMTCDASGRLPFFYLADGAIKIRLANAAGVTQLTADGLLVIGPSSGGGGGASVDATTVLATGDVKPRYGTGALSGFVRMNGRTIGSATSGASERANADTQALFEFLWTADANLTVSTGRGASAAADWAANKTITLPDARGRVLAALDDMGNTAASRLTATYFGTSAIVLGAVGGSESRTLLTANLPAYTPAGTVAITDNHKHHTFADADATGAAVGASNQSTVRSLTADITQYSIRGISTAATVGLTSGTSSGSITAALTGTAQGGVSTPIAAVPPMILVTYYIKL
jgi:hypothetical protein